MNVGNCPMELDGKMLLHETVISGLAEFESFSTVNFQFYSVQLLKFGDFVKPNHFYVNV